MSGFLTVEEANEEGFGIECPKCGSFHNSVLDSRPANQSIRRRRLCNECAHRWSTFEQTALNGADNKPEPVKKATVYLPQSVYEALGEQGSVSDVAAAVVTEHVLNVENPNQ